MNSLVSELPAGTYTVSEFAWEMKGVLADAYPAVWVAGEVQRLRSAARGQLYFELIEKGRGDRIQAKLDCVLWADERAVTEAELREAGVELSEGVVLRCCGRPEFWPGGGRLQFTVREVDPLFSLGALEKRRRETLRALEAEGLLERNKKLALAPDPLEIGLITSEGSAAYHDFLDTLVNSGLGFRVHLVHSAVQGAAAETEIDRAFNLLGAFARGSRRLDAIALVRGGGSRSDLATFDSRRVARAVARSPVPVICGVGHQIDVSIADVVAHTSCKTPTEAAEFLAGRVGEAAYRVEDAGRSLARQATDLLRAARRRVSSVPPRLASPGRALLRNRVADCRLAANRARTAAERLVAAARQQEEVRREGLIRNALRPVGRAAERLEAHARLCEQLSPERALARGFSVTRRADGGLVRRAADVAAGDELRTRIADGTVASTVDSGTPASKETA
ncbi:MAG: exodeoxyribonuclease VII large subunit [Holophagales bacterium]|nr:exodeoxyribonuclease VII large subunit [Holophagales bacterium]MYG32275.1 exodeoxyribonuclease VII large subunit [Holophagales bacterium]MYI78556.1 exodeoxyribonuclease VII large subunit [Holophagales bacterium]